MSIVSFFPSDSLSPTRLMGPRVTLYFLLPGASLPSFPSPEWSFLLSCWKYGCEFFYSIVFFFLYPLCNYRPKQDLNLGLGKSELLYRWPKLLSYYCWEEVIVPGHYWLWWHEERLPMLLIRHKMEPQLEENTVTKKEQDKIKTVSGNVIWNAFLLFANFFMLAPLLP